MNKKMSELFSIVSIVSLVLGIVFTMMNLFEKTKNERNPIIALLCVSVSNLCSSMKRFYDDNCDICENEKN